jgi:ankyrin repeat protein
MAASLIDQGANVDATDSNGMTALHHACVNGHYEVAKLLLERNADKEIAYKPGLTPLYCACSESPL